MKVCLVALIAILSTSSAFAFGSGPVRDVCDKQIREYVSSHYGANVTSIRYQFPDRNGDGTAWVSTDQCDGYEIRLRAGEHTCSNAHYGNIPNYIERVTPYGSCNGDRANPPAQPQLNVCEQQIHDYMANEFQTTVTGIRFIDAGENSDTQAWVSTPMCSGYYVFNMTTSVDNCNTAHYGAIPNYIGGVWTYGACRDDFTPPANPAPNCPAGTHAVAQYNWKFEFIGWACEKDSQR